MKRNYVFTYGTLLKGERNHEYYLKDEDYICDGFITGYKMFNLGRYPGIKIGEGIVLGEIYLVDDETLATLDYLEEEGSLYIRRIVSVNSSNDIYDAFVYIYNQNVDNPMYLGDGIYSWRKLDNISVDDLIEMGIDKTVVTKYLE